MSRLLWLCIGYLGAFVFCYLQWWHFLFWALSLVSCRGSAHTDCHFLFGAVSHTGLHLFFWGVRNMAYKADTMSLCLYSHSGRGNSICHHSWWLGRRQGKSKDAYKWKSWASILVTKWGWKRRGTILIKACWCPLYLLYTTWHSYLVNMPLECRPLCLRVLCYIR